VGNLPWHDFTMPPDCTAQEFRATVRSHWYFKPLKEPSKSHPLIGVNIKLLSAKASTTRVAVTGFSTLVLPHSAARSSTLH
jgi:hypothetical protein